MRKNDLTGQRFGKLTVIEEVEKRTKSGYVCWKCLCDCGNTTVVSGKNLKSGNTHSCGCYKKEQISKANTEHGMAGKRLYRIWKNMKSRCYCPNKPDYRRYGALGVEVCKEWREDFTAFETWALANGYSEDLTIDRIDFKGNYEPNNCRWTTQRVQARNREMSEYNKYSVPGVCKINGRYRVRIRVDEKAFYYGTYDTIEEAKEARKQAELKHWGFTNIK